MAVVIPKTLNANIAGASVTSEEPLGNKNGVNLEFKAKSKYLSNTLQVSLSGLELERGLDYTEESDNKTFTLIIDPDDRERLDLPPEKGESLLISYIKV